MNNPLVSIIIPTFNRAHLIGETLDSVLAQTYTHWECIIVDDGSTDDTDKLLASYSEKDTRFQYHHRPSNRPKGANACRNYGFEVSKGKYIQFLDSGDILEKFCLHERVALILNDNSVNLLIRDTSLYIDNIKQDYSINKDPEVSENEAYLRKFLRYEIPWQTMGAFYKRDIFATCNFEENLGRFQDVSFNIKVLSQFQNLKLLRNFKIDSYYRVDAEKVHKKGFVANNLISLINFNQVHLNLIEIEKYKFDLRKFNCKIILEFVIPYFYGNKKSSNKFFKWALNAKIFNLHQKLNFIFLMLFLNSGIFTIKGIGMNKFRNHLKKVMNE